MAVKLASLQVACVIAACVGLATLLRDSVLGGRSIKILEAGSVLLYGGLGLVTTLLHPG